MYYERWNHVLIIRICTVALTFALLNSIPALNLDCALIFLLVGQAYTNEK